MKKIVFLDIDGTLTAQDGTVPESAKIAIITARKHGHLIFLCTGRSLPEISDEILSIGFDGIIGAGGSYIEIDEDIILHEKIDPDDVKKALNYFENNDIAYYLESNQGLFSSDNCISRIKETSHRLFRETPSLFINPENPEPYWFYDILQENRNKKPPINDVNKISFIGIDHKFEIIQEKFKDCFEIHHATVLEFGPNSGELGLKGFNKYTAIQRVKALIGPDYDSYAYGDGHNDLDMFKAVSYSVAMKNAKESLKNNADEITDIAERDGIYDSFLKNGLITN